ncbi:MAG TPA: GNAT family N-acetyltransferase, partial [Bacillota bacterium]|nr:GNAT family N-acetyltransferase [Bacillota bacterium]
LEGNHRCVLVAETEGSIAGMVTAQLVVSTAEGAYSGWIEDMVLFPEYRQQGIGHLLLQAIETWCYQNGAVRVQLLADRENRPALEFYSKNGWQQTQLMGLRKLFDE